MSNDATTFVAEIDGRVADYLQEIRERADAAKADLESGTLSLRAKAEPGAAPRNDAPDWGDAGSSGGPDESSAGDLDQFDNLAQPSNGSHPLDAPIFGDNDSFLSDDLDFSIDLDDSLPS